MNKLQPNTVIDLFVASLTGLAAYYKSTQLAVPKSIHRQGEYNRLAGQTLLAAMTYWEPFASELAIAIINRDSEPYALDMERRVRSSVKDRFGDFVSTHTSVSLPTHLTYSDISSLIDPRGENLEFKDCEDMLDKASRWFADPYRAKFLALDPADMKALDAARKIRNYIAHNSSRSWKEMNKALATVHRGHAGNAGLGRASRQVHSTGYFLQQTPWGQVEPRVLLYCTRLRGIAEKLKT